MIKKTNNELISDEANLHCLVTAAIISVHAL